MSLQGEGGVGWRCLLGNAELRRRLETRSKILQLIRRYFVEQGFLEIDVPVLVPLPGMEPHLRPIPVSLHTEKGNPVQFYLHTSPEYALKKLLAAGYEKIFSLGHAFRDGEVSATHNPEFTLLEWYRAHEGTGALMRDCERLFLSVAEELGLGERLNYRGVEIDLRPPWPELTLAEAMRKYADVEITGKTPLEELVEIARRKGYREASTEWPWDDVFFLIFLNEVEPRFPKGRPLFLTDYPIQMGALARRKPDDPYTVERFELYVGGLELANAFGELTDPLEQRQRLQRERALRQQLGREVYPVDESFLEALEEGMPAAAGIALGVDRLVMLFTDAPTIDDVLAFPFRALLEDLQKSL